VARPESPGAALLGQWRRLSRLPGGEALFSRVLGWKVPYTGALGARVRLLEPGRARITLRVRRGVRNHLGSAHAVALTNLGELTTGLAVLTALPPGVPGIVLRLESEFLKKGRGLLTAEAEAGPIEVEPGDSTEFWVDAVIRDLEGDPVARVRALWLLGRRGSGSS
jgi:acyl-coenzyme A thioesterase PaaI-like protein